MKPKRQFGTVRCYPLIILGSTHKSIVVNNPIRLKYLFPHFERYMKSITALLSIGGIAISLIGITFFEAANAFIHITSPPKEEAVPAGAPLEISGDSSDTAQSNCKVLVVVDDKQPYQEATPTGGPNDYSTWSFTVSPPYAEIEEGLNKITAKATCDSLYSPELKQDLLTKQYEKHYSINVTGIPGGNLAPPFAAPTGDLGVSEGGEGEGGEGEGGVSEGGEGEGGVSEGGESDSTDEDSLFG
jgi:hypothetical protein